MSVSPTIPKPHVDALPAPGWPPIQRDVAGDRDPASLRRMNLNESPFPPAPAAIEAMMRAVQTVNYYPDPKWRDLTAKISRMTGHPADRIVVSHGSSELIANAGRFSLLPGDEVVVPTPSFGGYAGIGKATGSVVVPVRVRQDGACDVDGMIEAINDKTRIVWVCTPNNPTGQLLCTEEVMRLAHAVPETALLVVDEAYYEYGRHAGGDNHLDALSARRGPWVSFRTFSKAYGLAGMRIGYALCGSDEVTEAFQKMRPVFNVNAVAQAGALAALDDQDHMISILERTRIERERLDAGIRTLGFEPFPSVGNYLAARVPARCGMTAAEIVGRLIEEHGIMIGRLMVPGFEDYIRITTGRTEDTDALLAALEDMLGRA